MAVREAEEDIGSNEVEGEAGRMSKCLRRRRSHTPEVQ